VLTVRDEEAPCHPCARTGRKLQTSSSSQIPSKLAVTRKATGGHWPQNELLSSRSTVNYVLTLNRRPAGRAAQPRWPHSGHTEALNAAACCASMIGILPGQSSNGQIASTGVDLYGSEGWGFESLRARHVSAGQGHSLGYDGRPRRLSGGRISHNLMFRGIRVPTTAPALEASGSLPVRQIATGWRCTGIPGHGNPAGVSPILI
jgi:hypothetical protein